LWRCAPGEVRRESIATLIRVADCIGPCRKLNQRRLKRQFKASLTRAGEHSSDSVLRGPLGPLPSRHRAQSPYTSFKEFDSPVGNIKSGSPARLPLLSVSVSLLPSEQGDEVESLAAEVGGDEVTTSVPREITEEVDQISGTIIVRGFPSHLRVLTIESENSRRALGWDLYRKFGDPSTQSGVEELDVGKETAGLEGASIVYNAETQPDPEGAEVANGLSVPSHQPKVQHAAATARDIPPRKGYHDGGRLNARRRH